MSLAEIILSMAILSVVILAILTVMARGMDLNRRDAEVYQTTMYCNEVMEQALYAASSTAFFDNPSTVPSGYTFIGTPSSSQLQYIYAETVVPFAYVQNLGYTLKKITVAMYAQDRNSPVPAPDASRTNGGRIIQMSTLAVRPSQP